MKDKPSSNRKPRARRAAERPLEPWATPGMPEDVDHPLNRLLDEPRIEGAGFEPA